MSAADAALADHARAIDTGWLLTMTFNILVMQAGFAGLEVGMSAAASAAAIAMKNMSDMAVCCIGFWLTGWALAFGKNAAGQSNAFSGEGQFLLLGETDMARFVFQYAFAATSVTIVSGAVVGRIRFKHYVLLAFTISSFIYPIVAHVAWDPTGFLHQMGFVDFAGSTVAHVTGGSIGLAASLWLGPRPGVFRDTGDYVPQRSSPTQALMGAICLWYTWFSFNAGSTKALTNGGATLAAHAAVSTLLASGAGFLCSLAWSWIRSKGQHIDVFDSVTGLLAGLVAITSGCASVQPWEAVIVGALGSLAALATVPMLERLRIDDSVAVIPVHLVGGAVGTLLTGFFANNPADSPGVPVPQRLAGALHGGGGELLGVQALGVLFVVCWASLCFVVVALVVQCCMGGLRVPSLLLDKVDETERASHRGPPAASASHRTVGAAADRSGLAGNSAPDAAVRERAVKPAPLAAAADP
ncbi:hypothetical protein FNF27_06322 [Cafeteria roenbergensis]|uniref:Ammonium transporter AmtB-like domain-containing protein n=1 Tax=Cafeteria roenbergensis TaxID=33653 RepID=A0A5A8C264_CAFRO|nr:hypothetical protein FNF29_07755 [Cafeteria roenbergensis]KAA0164150.1 hypothetical protein FNF28_03963 [Cafeteria roenbergensis]KAA0171412.1 hypothetical protein FNF27_06322 [Cafeteria roenbergensis]|eukprot:KAA0146874.1 hypothetical protein FNF29_07755 [Cafeteria roenbergensis]